LGFPFAFSSAYKEHARYEPQVLIFIGGGIGFLFNNSLDHHFVMSMHGREKNQEIEQELSLLYMAFPS
jgi:hypothetical protein